MGGTFYRNARTNAVEGQQTAYVNLWDPLAHGHWPGADGRFGGGEADAGDSRNGGVDDLERLRPPLAVRMRVGGIAAWCMTRSGGALCTRSAAPTRAWLGTRRRWRLRDREAWHEVCGAGGEWPSREPNIGLRQERAD